MTDNTQNTNEQVLNDQDIDSSTVNSQASVERNLSIITTVDELQKHFFHLQKLSRSQPVMDWSTRVAQLNNL